ncbi:hypothetical protein Lalb_Chr04g0250871 [Lupinus albus]|uniref:Uncharacterized protein n=1 Tax=Lupinus albus TaxID=3870 RepID=A0A6A4QM10_LUPAL|nr:hypothetical protein Lalb_Chr04g0250871 [Lupinus albus]
MFNEIKQNEDKPPKRYGAEVEGYPTFYRPVSRISAFSFYNPPGRPANSHGSLLGPEFVYYLEPTSFTSHELISIATDLNNIVWINSGLENYGAVLAK